MKAYAFALGILAISLIAPPTYAAGLPHTLSVHSPGVIEGVITAISTDRFTVMPETTDGMPDLAPFTLTIDSATKIVMRGTPAAHPSDLAIGYVVLVSRRHAIAATADTAAVPASTLIQVSPRYAAADSL